MLVLGRVVQSGRAVVGTAPVRVLAVPEQHFHRFAVHVFDRFADRRPHGAGLRVAALRCPSSLRTVLEHPKACNSCIGNAVRQTILAAGECWL